MRRRSTIRLRGAASADDDHGVGGRGALLQTAVTTSLAAAALGSRVAAVGFGATLVVACFDTSVALLAAIIHFVVVVAYTPDISSLPAIAAGLLGGMLLTPWALSAVLTWAIVVVASVVTAFELGASLWFALIPVSVVSVLLGVTSYSLWTHANAGRSLSDKSVDLEAPLLTAKVPRRREAQREQLVNLFV